jgi:hypothetical protein
MHTHLDFLDYAVGGDPLVVSKVADVAVLLEAFEGNA